MVFVALTVGIGFTVTVTVVVDEHIPAVAVIVNVVVIGAVVLFVNVPEILDPLPLFAIPARPPGVVLVQVNIVPATLFGFVISIWVIAVPVHTVCVTGVALIEGFGFTVNNTEPVLVHPLAPVAVAV